MATIYSRPKTGTQTGRVWAIADELTERDGKRARRADVIDAFVREGGSPNTANTQYQYWKADFESRPKASNDGKPRRSFNLQMKEGGRVLFPAELREMLGLSEGDDLVGEVADGELRLMTRAIAVQKARDLVRQFVPADISLVDELLTERRAEVERERRR